MCHITRRFQHFPSIGPSRTDGVQLFHRYRINPTLDRIWQDNEDYKPLARQMVFDYGRVPPCQIHGKRGEPPHEIRREDRAIRVKCRNSKGQPYPAKLRAVANFGRISALLQVPQKLVIGERRGLVLQERQF
jgi:hypothetical protein